MQKRLDEHGKGGKQLEQVELRLEVGEEAGKGDQACLAAHTQLCCKKKETVQVNACTALRVPELSHLAAGNDSGKGGNCVKPKLRSGR